MHIGVGPLGAVSGDATVVALGVTFAGGATIGVSESCRLAGAPGPSAEAMFSPGLVNACVLQLFSCQRQTSAYT